MKCTTVSLTCLGFLLILSCGGQNQDLKEQDTGANTGTNAPSTEEVSSEEDPAKGPLRWKAPEGWNQVTPETTQRACQFEIPVEGEDPLTVIGYLFPSGVGGLDANLGRWTGNLGLSKDDQQPSIDTLTPNGLIVTLFDGSGDFQDNMGGAATDGARFLAAYVESPTGRFKGVATIKLVGPAEHVKPWAESFREFALGL